MKKDKPKKDMWPPNHYDIPARFPLITQGQLPQDAAMGEQLYEVLLSAKRDFDINNIALELKVHSLYDRNFMAHKCLNSKRNSRWKLVRNAFRFVSLVNMIIAERKIKGFEIKAMLNDNIEQTIDINSLNWLSGTLPQRSRKLTKRKRYIIYEDSKFLKYWNYLMMSLYIYTATFLPYQLSFIETETAFLTALDIIITLIFILDIVVHFLCAFTRNGEVVEDLRSIFFRYVKTWLILDVISVMPFDYFISSDGNKLGRLARLTRVVKLLRILRLLKVSDKLSKNKITKKISGFLNINRQFGDLFSFFIIIIFLSHITSCLWHFLVHMHDSNTWLDKLERRPTSNFGIYITAFYWAISTISTVGFGDIVPSNVTEKLFNIFWIGVGIAFYSYTIGTLASLLNVLNRKKSAISSRFAFLNEFSKTKDIDKVLLEKITVNLELIEDSKNYKENNIEMNFLNDISLKLTNELARHIHRELIEKVVLFNSNDIGFVAHVLPFFVTRWFRPGEIVYKRNEYPSFLYFTLQGDVGFFNENNIMINTYVEGSYFGELEIFKSSLRRYQVKSLTETKLLLLPREALLQGLRCFQALGEQLYRTAIKRDIINKRYTAYTSKMRFVECNTVLAEEAKQNLCTKQQTCYKLIQQLKKKINIYAIENSNTADRPNPWGSNRTFRPGRSIKTSFFKSKFPKFTDESHYVAEEPHMNQYVTQLKLEFDTFRREIQGNNKYLRMLLGQCLGESIEFMPTTGYSNVALQCDMNNDYSISYLTLKESEIDAQKANPKTSRNAQKGHRKSSRPQPLTIALSADLKQVTEPGSSIDSDDPNNTIEESIDAIKINRVNLFEDPEFKRICQHDSDAHISDLDNSSQEEKVKSTKSRRDR